MAANMTLDFSDPDTLSTLGVANEELSSGTHSLNGFTVKLGSNRAVKDDYIQFGSNSDAISFATSSENSIATLIIASNKGTESKPDSSDRTPTWEPKTSVTSDSGNVSVNKTSSVPLKFTLKDATTYTISNMQNARLYSITVAEPGSTGETSWTVDAAETPVAGNVKLVPIPGSNNAVLEYTGDDNEYSVIPKMKIVKPDSNHVSEYKLDLTGEKWKDYLVKNLMVPKASIKITGGAANRVLHLECDTHNTVYSIKLDENGNAMGMLTEGANGGYEVSEMDNIPLHEGKLIGSIAGGQLDGNDTKEFNLSDSEKTISAGFTAFVPAEISASVGPVYFDDLKVTSVARAERLLGSTIIDINDAHNFFVVADKGTITDSVFALADPNASPDVSGTKMKAVVIRHPGAASGDRAPVAEGDGVGFTLANNGQDDTDVYHLTVYCTAVQDIKDENAANATIGIRKIDKDSYAPVEGSDVKGDIVNIVDTSVTDFAEVQQVHFYNLDPGSTYCVYNPTDEDQGNLRIFAI